MNILLINQDWFAGELRAAGHQVWVYGPAPHLEIVQTAPLVHVEAVIQSLGGPRPQVIVVYDNSSPLTISGLDQIDIPAIFYSVDAHHHAYLHKYLGHLCDYTLLAQKDYAGEFQSAGVNPEWMPLWASRVVEADSEKQHGAVFVGTLDEKLNPGRVAFFSALKEKAPLFCTTGYWWEIFPKSEIVINQTVKGDLNFRVFEAMVSGALLLTERSGNGLFELFEDGRHLAAYEKDNVEDAARMIGFYLSKPEICRAIAHAGRQEILAHHLPRHRAQRLLEILQAIQKINFPCRHLAAMMNFALLARPFERTSRVLAASALAAALRAGVLALSSGEKLNIELACYAVIAALRFDILNNASAGAEFLQQLNEAYPQFEILAMARLRTLLNNGHNDEARRLARQISDQNVEQTFQSAEHLVSSLLQGF